MIWTAVLLTASGCFLLKLAGFVVPASWVEQPAVSRVVGLLPVALLAALIAVGTLTEGSRLVLDARAAGLAVAAAAVWLRAPFVVVVLLAAGVTAALRLI